MNRLLLITLLLVSILFVNASARIVIIDPGNPDWVIIGGDAIAPGDTAAVSMTVTTDEFVDYVNIPLGYDGTSLHYERCEFLGPFDEFDAIFAEERPGDSMVVIMGWSNMSWPPNPYFNTNGVPQLCAILYFTALPGIPEDTYPVEITYDGLTGPLFFGDTLGQDSWEPLYENGFVQVVSEQGFADSVIIGFDSIPVEEDATIQLSILNDEDVDQIVIPFSYDELNFSMLGYQLAGDIYYWDNIFIENIPGSGIITLMGQALAGNPKLNTNAVPEVVAEFYFAVNPGAAPGMYPLAITTDPLNGPLSFHGADGTQWAPFSRNGYIQIILPPTCNMANDYIFGYGFCQSPTDDRRCSCRIRNFGNSPAENVQLIISHPAEFIYQLSNPPAVVDNNTMTWNLGTIPAGGWYFINYWVDIPQGLGEINVVTTSDITSSTPDVDLVNNHREFEEVVGFSYDPNDKIVDPAGFGTNHFVPYSNALMYIVYFENSDSATLPATDILILDTLDNRLDWNTFVVGPMSHPDPCSVWIDQSTGIVSCFCDDILLPPNDNPPEGEGYFSFSILPKWNISTGDVVSNKAYIRFDINDWIPAPLGEPVFVTYDVSKPVSRVMYLEPQIYSVDPFDILWEGSDGAGSGIQFYDIYWAQDGGPFNIWISQTNSTSATFYPESGHAYAFYSNATDNLGLTENAPGQPDAVTYVFGGCPYLAGNANGNAPFNGLDVTYSVNYLKGLGGPPPDVCDCPGHGLLYAAADANGNCAFNGLDVTYSVNFLKGLGPAPLGCNDCPPAFSRFPRHGYWPQQIR